jgi:hypothetical protein
MVLLRVKLYSRVYVIDRADRTVFMKLAASCILDGAVVGQHLQKISERAASNCNNGFPRTANTVKSTEDCASMCR